MAASSPGPNLSWRQYFLFGLARAQASQEVVRHDKDREE
jgi:hypothetical protein